MSPDNEPMADVSARGTALRVVGATLAFVGLYVAVGLYVGHILGGAEGAASAATATGVNPEHGEAVFWDNGKCHTCHSIGTRGSAVRGPNLEGIGSRAEERAADVGVDGATAYLVQALAEPASYAVEGYDANVMPKVYLPPISLTTEELQAVITYLQSQGGTVAPEEIVLPDEVLAAASGAAPEAAAWAPYASGDPEAGEDIFRNGAEGAPACAACHTIGGEGGNVGPELDEVAALRGPAYVIESILYPQAQVVAGFEGQLMPPVFRTSLNVQQLHDVLAFLMESANLPIATPRPES
jgi:cytochrome c2